MGTPVESLWLSQAKTTIMPIHWAGCPCLVLPHRYHHLRRQFNWWKCWPQPLSQQHRSAFRQNATHYCWRWNAMCSKVGLWKWSLHLIGVVFLKEERGIVPARWIHTMGYPSHSPSNLACTGLERASWSTCGSLQDEESCTTVCLMARTWSRY